MINKAFCFDLSGTITKEEIIPLLGKKLGIYEEIKMLTEATANGEITSHKSLILRVNLVKKLDLYETQKKIAEMELNSKILNFIMQNSQQCFVLTSALDIWLKQLKLKIPSKFFSSISEVENNQIKGINHILDKKEAINNIKSDFDQIISIGGDMGDVEMFQASDINIAFPKTNKPVQSLIEESNFVTFSEDGLCHILNTLL